MTNQHPPSGEQATVRGPRGPKLWLILLALVSFFALALYVILHHGPGYSEPAQVGKGSGNSGQTEVAQVQTPSDVPPMASAPPSAASPKPWVYGGPPGLRYAQESRKATESVATSPQATPMAMPSVSPEYKIDMGEQISRTSSQANADASNRLSERIDRDSYSLLEEEQRLVRSMTSQTRVVEVLSYPKVRTSNLAEALEKPDIEIKLRAAKGLRVGGTAIESGDYILKPKWNGSYWDLLFFGSNTTKPAAVLTLIASGSPSKVDRLSVFVIESENRVFLVVRGGSDQLTGQFEIE